MHLPAPLRAAVGLVASAADEAKRLPDRAIELPMLAVSTALQASLRAQQRYARLTARGDEVLRRGRTSDQPPQWATFDEPVTAAELYRTTLDQQREAQALHGGESAREDADAPAKQAPRKRTPRKTPTTKTAPRTAPATKAAPRTAPATKAAPRTAPTTKAAPRTAPATKNINAPRNQAPSAFDRVPNEPEDTDEPSVTD